MTHWLELAELLDARKLPNACVYCGVVLTPSSFTIDHVIPKSRGGTNDLSNMVPACRSCNSSKGARTPEEWLG